MAGRKVLIIEDDHDIAHLLAARLKAHDCEVVLCRDAVNALGVARNERPDLILLDLNLPGGNGILILERLRAFDAFALTPVIVISAQAPDVAEAQALAAGARRFLAKPVNTNALLEAIDELVPAAASKS
jgi:DNA-binding response OmpR family regulator